MKNALRLTIITILAIGLQENFTLGALGWSMVLYAVAMKSSNIIFNQLKEFDNGF